MAGGVAVKTFDVLPSIKFGNGILAEMLLVGGGADNAVGGHSHQVWRRDPSQDDAG